MFSYFHQPVWFQESVCIFLFIKKIRVAVKMLKKEKKCLEYERNKKGKCLKKYLLYYCICFAVK